jgi:hypothetical protein
MDDGVMFTIEWSQGKPSLADAAHILQVQESDLDRSFGVVLIDPDKNEYTVLCRSQACASVGEPRPGVKGPYSNPSIGTFGPPEHR